MREGAGLVERQRFQLAPFLQIDAAFNQNAVWPAAGPLTTIIQGLEVVLFTYGMLASGQSISTVLSGSLLGTAVGALLGGALYLGLVKVPTKYIFQVTTWLLLFLTAGMAC